MAERMSCLFFKPMQSGGKEAFTVPVFDAVAVAGRNRSITKDMVNLNNGNYLKFKTRLK